MHERRRNERRINQQACTFPHLTSSGEVIESDRRVLAERRVNNISVEEISYEEFIKETAKLTG